MAWDGSGGYDRLYNWVADRDALIDITASRMDAEQNGFATGLENCVTRDGQNFPTSDLPMNNQKHTGVASAADLTNYASADDVIDFTLLYAGASAAGTDTYAANLPITPVAYKAGQFYAFKADVANTGACTVNFNSIGAASIKLANGSNPETGDIQIGIVIVQYDGTNMQLMNSSLAGLVASQFLRSDQNDVTTGSITIENVNPIFKLSETGVTADNGLWDHQVQTEQLNFRTRNDADNAGNNWLSVTRTGTTVDKITLSATEIALDATALTKNGTSIYELVILDTPVLLAADTSTSATANTAVDITAQTTGVAVKAILNINLSGTSATVDGNSEVLVGEGGETLTTEVHRAAIDGGNNISSFGDTNQITVNLATGEIFDYEILQSGTAPGNRRVSIYLAGYYK